MIVERFMSRVEKRDGHWYWQGYISAGGYGRFRMGREQWAHRVSYILFVGPIPDGLEIDHICRIPSCVNPECLQVVTHQQNVARRIWPVPTHCKRGHEFTSENIVPRPKGGPTPDCRICKNARQRRYKERVRLTAATKGEAA